MEIISRYLLIILLMGTLIIIIIIIIIIMFRLRVEITVLLNLYIRELTVGYLKTIKGFGFMHMGLTVKGLHNQIYKK